jgi:RNA polymerase sigma factor (sigma-70 family)
VAGPRWAGADPSPRATTRTRGLRSSARFAGRQVLRTQTDQRLVELTQCGSEPAFETIVERYRGPLRKYCSRLVPSSRVDDVLQQAFLDAYRAIRKEGRSVNLRPWLYRVTHNVAVDTLRQESRGWKELSDRPQGIGRADPSVDGRESLRDLLSTLQGLPKQQRAALVLREMEGRSYEEISEELGVSESAVAQLLARARHGLQAGASAMLPPGLLLRAPAAGSGGERVAELVSAGGAVGLAKAVAVIAVAGAVGGTVLTPGREAPSKARDRSGKELAPSTKPVSVGEALRSAGQRSGRDRTQVGRDRSNHNRPGTGRIGDRASGEHGVTRNTGPSPDPERSSDEDEIDAAAPLTDDDGADPDDGSPNPAPSDDEDQAQDVDSPADVESLPEVEPGSEIEPELEPPADAP